MAAYWNIYGLFLFLNLLNLIVCGLVIAVASINITDSPTNVIIYNAYTGCLCLLLAVAEIRIPAFIETNLRFLCTYRGRGLLYTFFGCLVYSSNVFNIAACVFIVTIGIAYFILSWVPLAPPRFGIVDNWRAWTMQGTRNLYRTARKPEEFDPRFSRHSAYGPKALGDDILEYHEDQYLSKLRGEDIEMIPPTLQRSPPARPVAHQTLDAELARHDSMHAASLHPEPPTLQTTLHHPPCSLPLTGDTGLAPSTTVAGSTAVGTPLVIQDLAAELDRQYPIPPTMSFHGIPGTPAHDQHHLYHPSGIAPSNAAGPEEWHYHPHYVEPATTAESDRTVVYSTPHDGHTDNAAYADNDGRRYLR